MRCLQHRSAALDQRPLLFGLAIAFLLSPLALTFAGAPDQAAAADHATSPPASRPALPPKQPAKVGTVLGRAWLKRRDGTSGFIDGMRVTLLKPDVEKATMVAALEAAAEAYDKHATQLQQEADAVRARSPHLPPNNGPWRAAPPGAPPAPPPDPGRALADEAAKEAAKGAAARALIRTLPNRMSVPDFHKMLGEHSPSAVPDFEQVIKSGEIASATTDVDGKFTLKDVPEGSSYVYGQVIAYRAYDWVVQVGVKEGKTVDVKLTNNE